MRTSRRRLNVDVEELDRVIDAAEDGPLSKSDCQKLKTTLHALVERLAQKAKHGEDQLRAGTEKLILYGS
jgi:hypothetical protein